MEEGSEYRRNTGVVLRTSVEVALEEEGSKFRHPVLDQPATTDDLDGPATEVGCWVTG